MKNKIYDAKEGYDLIASYYDNWKWQKFWHENEYPYIEKWCENIPQGIGLNLGVGSGNNIACFFSKGNKIKAIDISPEMLAICKQKYPDEIRKGNLECKILDINGLPEQTPKYDWVISNRVFSHIKNIDSTIKKLSRIIKPGGQCFISDVHPLHQYKNTNISIRDNQISIETYKHNTKEFSFILDENYFDILEYKEITKNDLINKEILTDFPNLQTQDSPIFYYYIIKRKEG